MFKKKLMVKRLYSIPELYYRSGACSILKSLENNNYLILVADGVVSLEYYKKVKTFFDNKTFHEEIISSPYLDGILSIRNKYIDSNIEVILAFGGGSVIDSAKILSILIDNKDLNLDDLINNEFLQRSSTKLAIIPTTPGTGSESNSISVVIGKNGIKIPILNQGFLADMAILDHKFIINLPQQNLYEFCADIFSHIWEGTVSIASTPIIKALGNASLDMLKSGLSKYKENNDDNNAFAEIMYAGHLAGKVQGNAFVGVCHALAHTMEQFIKINHSVGILSILKPVLEWEHKIKPKPEFESFLKVYDELEFDQYRKSDFLKEIPAYEWAEAALKDPSINTTPIKMKKENLIELISWIQK